MCKKAKKIAQHILDNSKKYDMYVIEHARSFLKLVDKKNKNQITKSLVKALERSLKDHG